MKAKVKLTYSVELSVEGKNEEDILTWLACTTPSQAVSLASGQHLKENSYANINEDYTESVLCVLENDAAVDYVIK